ncbi:hypothetical protein QAD02_015811 [Eretmocerus hayati]|uniref:Uncharacterized protein n=1 Tax=Eretmocerus hayati TaxID=131215 RepID=A0ACC2P9Q5_9HYME|nr:hypothetical protein QAD02_015811 [Eretmocerus hayati]
MTRDRMPDLCMIRKNSLPTSNSFLRNVQAQMNQNKKLHDLLEDAKETRSLIDVMIENIQIVKNVHNNVLLHTSQDIQKELETRTYTISQLAHRIYSKLKELGKGVVDVGELTLDTARDGPTYERIKILQYTTMFRMYSQTMQDYNQDLLRYYDKRSSILHRQKRILRQQITSDEFDSMLDSEETHLFVNNILLETKLAQQQLSEIQTRHDEIRKLEKSIAEVKDIFLEMAFLVEKQGEQLDCIEYFASRATENVDHGRNRLHKVNEKKKLQRLRKLKLIFIIFFVSFLILLLLMIF